MFEEYDIVDIFMQPRASILVYVAALWARHYMCVYHPDIAPTYIPMLVENRGTGGEYRFYVDVDLYASSLMCLFRISFHDGDIDSLLIQGRSCLLTTDSNVTLQPLQKVMYAIRGYPPCVLRTFCGLRGPDVSVGWQRVDFSCKLS